MNAWKRSFRFLGVTKSLIGSNGRLILLPLASVIFSMALVELFYHRSYFTLAFPQISSFDPLYDFPVGSLRAWLEVSKNFELEISIGLSMLISLITLFFTTSLVHSVLDRLNGEDFSLRNGLQKAASKAPTIFWWAIASSLMLVGLKHLPSDLTNFSFNKGTIGGLGYFIGVVIWSLASFFVIPTLIFEGVKLSACFKRSIQLLSGTWKEQMIFRIIFMLILVLLFWGSLIGLMKLFGIESDGSHWGIKSCIVAVWLTLASCLEIVFSAVLYSYAITGMSPEDFYDSPEVGRMEVAK